MVPMWEVQHPPGLQGDQKQTWVAAIQVGDGAPLHCQHAVRRRGVQSKGQDCSVPQIPSPSSYKWGSSRILTLTFLFYL